VLAELLHVLEAHGEDVRLPEQVLLEEPVLAPARREVHVILQGYLL